MKKSVALGLGAGLVALTLSTQATTYNDEVSSLIRAGRTAKALGPELFGDRINYYTGALEFVQSDVSIPGNDHLGVGVARRLVAVLAEGGIDQWLQHCKRAGKSGPYRMQHNGRVVRSAMAARRLSPRCPLLRPSALRRHNRCNAQ